MMPLSYRCKFRLVPTYSSVFIYMIPVENAVLVRNIHTSMKSDHILCQYRVKEVQGFVPVRDEWPSSLWQVVHVCQ